MVPEVHQEGLENRATTILEGPKAEIQRKCLEWMFEPKMWDDLVPREFVQKPQAIINHEQIPLDERKKLAEKYYLDNPEILKYYESRGVVFERNKSIIDWLNYIMEYCQTQEEHTKLKEKRAWFQKVTAKQGTELGIEKYIYDDPRVKEIQKVFG